MRKAAVMGESENRSAEKTADDVEVGSFGGEGERGGGQRGLAVETGSSQRRAEKKVSDGFQESC